MEVGQTMAFIVLALSELTHVFNIRNNKKSIFKTNIFNNSKLILSNIDIISVNVCYTINTKIKRAYLVYQYYQ